MPESAFVRALSLIYGVLIYSYPREFRLEYGREMKQVFRDQCSHLARTDSWSKVLHFAVLSGMDWMRTVVSERAAVIGSVVSKARKPAPRGFVAEAAMTILIYLFASATLVQAYVIPTGSMEGNLCVGDHMLVDRLTYGKPSILGHSCCLIATWSGETSWPSVIRKTRAKRSSSA
jgi:signal peptidase I